MTTTDTTTPPILTATLAAHRIQLAAVEAGLPLPMTVAVIHGDTELAFRRADLTTWALWLDTTIETRRVGGNVQHIAHVDWQDWPIRLVAVTAAGVAA